MKLVKISETLGRQILEENLMGIYINYMCVYLCISPSIKWQHFNFFFYFFNKFIYLFIYGCVGTSLLHAGFLQLQRAGATLHCSEWASHCSGFSCCGVWALGLRASVVVAHGFSRCGLQALERRLSSCGARAQLLHGISTLNFYLYFLL